MNEKTIKYWISVSDYDFETAKAMLEARRYLYVGFMAHQSIEKILKAYYVKMIQETPPYSHNLLLLAERATLKNDLSEEDIEFLSLLNPLNIEARYPKYKDELLNSLTTEKCEEILLKTERFQKWVKQKLKIS